MRLDRYSPNTKIGWRTVKFGDVVRQCKEKVDREDNPFERYVEGGHMDSEDLHIRRWGEFGEDYVGPAFHRIFREGQVLYGSRRTYLKKVAVAEFDGITANTTFVLETQDQSVFMQELLPFLMLTDRFTEHSVGESKGSTNPYINWPDIAKFEFPLPPIEEQKRIAEILWAADETMEQYSKSRVRLSSLRTRLFRESLSKCSAQPVPCSELFKYSPRNGHSPKTNASGKGSPTLSIGAVRDGRVEPNGHTKYAEVSAADLDKFRLEPGNILIVRGNGNRNLCGRAALVSEVPENCFYPDLLIRVAFDESKILPAFAVEQWNEPITHNRLLSVAKSTNGIWKINGKDLRQHTLQVPSLETQREIVEQLDEMSQREETIVRHIYKTQEIQRHLANFMIRGDAYV